MSKQNIDERRQNRILVGATVNAPGAELANSSHSHECIVGDQLQFSISAGTSSLGFSDFAMGQKITISVHRGKNTVTKVEGIPSQFSLHKLLKKLKAKDMLSCGGHVALDNKSGNEFLVLQGSFSSEVAAFLTREGLADADSIVQRG
jgi:translation initiation factor 1 (eIF-1/SUI1)